MRSDLTGASLGASAAGLVACGPLGEVGNLAVLWALRIVTFLGFNERRTRCTAKGSLDEHGPFASRKATTARFVAGSPLGVEGYKTIDGAHMMVTGLGLAQVRAYPFTGVGVRNNLTYTRRGTNPTAFGAFTPEAPIRNFTVQSARTLIT